MKTSKIVSVSDTGKVWNDFVKLNVVLEDGTEGVANAKSATPWYAEPGTDVEYEAKENSYGVMLRIKKPDSGDFAKGPTTGQKAFHAGMAATKDQDFIPQTMCHCIGPAVQMIVEQAKAECEGDSLHIDWTRLEGAMVVLYNAREAAIKKVREQQA